MAVTYGPPSALDALLAAANPGLAPWPTPPTVYVALDPELGTALMPNPTFIPATLLLQGSPPLALPSGVAGNILVSDASGNLTLQPVSAALPLPVTLANGGTGAVTASGARSNLGVPAKSANLSDMSSVNTCVTNLFTNFAASTNYKPTNPTATASTSLVMMGLGSAVNQTTPVVFTPKVTGIVEVTVRCGVVNNTAVVLTTMGCRYGTGTAPTNGTAVTGTRFGSSAEDVIEPGGTNRVQVISYSDIITGLALNTPVWFDIAAATAVAADTVAPNNISVNLKELPY